MEALDLRKIPCPRNTSKALIKLAMMDGGEVLEILLDDGEPIQNVPSSLTIEGHQILGQERTGEGHWVLKVKVS